MQWTAGRPVDGSTPIEELHPADLLFFDGESPQVSHVALSLGGGALIHAALANGGVDVNDLSGELTFDRWLRAHYIGARRVLATYGSTDALVRVLRDRGIDAEALRTRLGGEN